MSLSLVGLNFGFLIGSVAGLISFIPFVGSIVGFVLSVGVALVQFWPDWIWVLVVAGIFAAASSSRATSCSRGWSARASACIRSG